MESPIWMISDVYNVHWTFSSTDETKKTMWNIHIKWHIKKDEEKNWIYWNQKFKKRGKLYPISVQLFFFCVASDWCTAHRICFCHLFTFFVLSIITYDLPGFYLTSITSIKMPHKTIWYYDMTKNTNRWLESSFDCCERRSDFCDASFQSEIMVLIRQMFTVMENSKKYTLASFCFLCVYCFYLLKIRKQKNITDKGQ